VMTNVDIHAIVSTIENYENRTVTPISVRNNSVQSTVTNTNSNKQTVIVLAPILPNSKITQFPYSNIQGNVTIIFYDTNDKNWNSYWNYIVDFYTLFKLININSSFIFNLFQSWLNM